MSYSTFINGLKKAGNGLDRKILADIAANDAAGFTALAVQAKAALAAAEVCEGSAKAQRLTQSTEEARLRPCLFLFSKNRSITLRTF